MHNQPDCTGSRWVRSLCWSQRFDLELCFTEQNCISVIVPRPGYVSPRHIISNGRLWERERESERQRERDRDSLINWKRSSTLPFRVQTHGVIRTTLLSCHLPPFSLLHSPPVGKPFNQPRGEYMVMIWKERIGRQREKRDTRWRESISAVDTIVTRTALILGGGSKIYSKNCTDQKACIFSQLIHSQCLFLFLILFCYGVF